MPKESTLCRIIRAMREAQRDPEYQAANESKRAIMLTLFLCEAMEGPRSAYFPDPERVREALHRMMRNRDLRERFDGKNYDAMAAEYEISPRQVRRIVDRR